MRIGIALGSGGAKGLAHIGVLEVLQKNGINIDCIAGTSMGAIVGGLIALGFKPEELDEMACREGKKTKARINRLKLSAEAIYDTEYIHKKLFSMYKDRRFEDLVIPFYALATDLIKGEKVILDSGRVLDAVEASSRIPLYYPPIKREGMILVDGGVTCPVPVGVLKGKCDFIIAVPLPIYNKRVHPHHYLKIMNVVDRSISILIDKLMKTELQCEKPNFTIEIKGAENFSTFDFDHAKEIIEIGRKETKKVVKSLIRELKINA